MMDIVRHKKSKDVVTNEVMLRHGQFAGNRVCNGTDCGHKCNNDLSFCNLMKEESIWER